MKALELLRLTLFTRCALAVAAMQASGCEERERWPVEERKRDRPLAVLVSDELDCNHGNFCVSPSADVRAAAAAPYDQCEAFIALPPGEAKDVDAAVRPSLRIRFNTEETTKARSDGGQACCYTWFEHCRGRPFVVQGEAYVADVVGRDDWGLDVDIPVERSLVAERSWRREAAHEHVSAAAFLRLSAHLMALGAPHDLIARAVRSAEDELRHARIAFAIASAHGGRGLGPAPLELPAEPLPTRAELAASTYLEGCVAETVAAAILRDALPTMSPVIRRLMRGVAADEERHAAFSYRVAAWCMRDEAARVAVAEVARNVTLPASPDESVSYGVVSAARRRRVAEQALVNVVEPLTRALFSPRPRAHATRPALRP